MWNWHRIEITWGFAALLALALLAGAGEVLPLVLLASACHEAGHLAALGLMGARVERIRFGFLGAEIRSDTRRLSYGREILCVLAGPGVNLLLALVLARVSGDYLLAGANAVQGVFNLLPVPSLDGGTALHLFISFLTDPMAADRVCRWVGVVCALLLTAIAAVLVAVHGTGLFLLLGAAGMLLPQLTAFFCREEHNSLL